MGEVLEFRRKPPRRRGLCQHGHHRWKVVADNRFDVKAGRLVTVYRCERCGREKTTAH